MSVRVQDCENTLLKSKHQSHYFSLFTLPDAKSCECKLSVCLPEKVVEAF